MSDDERKPRLHIHTGGLIILIIILLILFRVDIKSKIKSEQFQKNITFIEDAVKNFWDDKILPIVKSKTSEVFMEATNEGLQKLQNGFTENVIKTTDKEKTTN